MAEVIRLKAEELPDGAALARVAQAARQGRIVAFPTDTVYGLGTSALSREGVERICRIKGRDPDKPLALLAASGEEARRWVEWTPQAEALARKFWPGGLTLVLKASAAGRGLACAAGPTLAVRVPNHPVARALLEASGTPWAQTSANASGEAPIADGAAVARRFGDDLAFVIDAGPAAGTESSVVDAIAEPPRVLREGCLPAADLLALAAAPSGKGEHPPCENGELDLRQRAVTDGVGSGVAGRDGGSLSAAPPKKILFVCTGNTCRSVMAEFLLRRLAPRRGLELAVRSAGVAAERYFQIPPGVRAALAAEGIRDLDHVPQLVGRELLDWAELVLVMERGHREMLLDKFPEFRAKIHTLKNHAGRAGPEDIADPIGRSDAVYAACCREIKESLEALLNRHEPHAQKPGP